MAESDSEKSFYYRHLHLTCRNILKFILLKMCWTVASISLINRLRLSLKLSVDYETIYVSHYRHSNNLLILLYLKHTSYGTDAA